MVFGEATVLFPLLASYAYHRGSWKKRKPMNYNAMLGEDR
jgi:deoxyhypusine synthase